MYVEELVQLTETHLSCQRRVRGNVLRQGREGYHMLLTAVLQVRQCATNMPWVMPLGTSPVVDD